MQLATEREILTYSSLRQFRDCRKMYFWRFIEYLVPAERPHVLSFGTLVHKGLKVWHETHDLHQVFRFLSSESANRINDPRLQRDYLLARAMLRGYSIRYPVEPYEIMELEKVFMVEIVNPETGAPSRTFQLGCRIDGLCRDDRGAWLREYKTAGTIDASYLERLWTDFQIILYTRIVQEVLGIRLEGVLYDILLKPRIQQKVGETEQEFEERRAALLAKSKTGKTSAERWLPESDEHFETRLDDRLAQPDAYHREALITDDQRVQEIQAELWELTQQLLICRRKGIWYQNTSFCFHYQRPCAYFPLCRSGGSELVKEQLYRIEPPHEELREDEEEG